MDNGKIVILHLIETTGPGGAETVLLNIVQQLKQEEFASIVVVTGEGWLHKKLLAAEIPTMILPSSKPNDWRFLRQVIRQVKHCKVDLIHSHLAGMNFYACLTGIFSRKPVIATYHGMVGDWNKKNLKNRIKYAVIKRGVRQVVAVSNYLNRELVQTWRFGPGRIQTIYNGVDFDTFDRAEHRASLKAELGIPADSRLIGMVGHIRPAKGYEYFIQAARIVANSQPDCYFLVVGEGKGRLFEDLKTLVRQLDLENRFIFTGLRDDVAEILGQLDVFLLSSTTEGLSIATIEAMGLGKPVVVTDSGGPREIVEDAVTGFLVPPANPHALAEKVVRLLEDKDLARNLGRRARAHVRAKFSLDQCVDSYIKLYRNCQR